MKCGQLIEYNMKKIFLKNHLEKWGGETIPRPFSKKLKLSIFLDQQPKFLCSFFLLCTKLRAIDIYWN